MSLTTNQTTTNIKMSQHPTEQVTTSMMRYSKSLSQYTSLTISVHMLYTKQSLSKRRW